MKTATVAFSISLAARRTRIAISPRFATRIFSNSLTGPSLSLTPDQVKGIEGNPDIAIDVHPKGTVVYLAANDSHPILGKDEVVQAMRHAIDYHAMADTFLAGQFVVHQAFWPAGLWAAYTETPYRRDIAQAKSLLEQAGHGDGFEVRIDTLTSSPYPGGLRVRLELRSGLLPQPDEVTGVRKAGGMARIRSCGRRADYA